MVRFALAVAAFAAMTGLPSALAAEAPAGASSCSGCHPANAAVQTPVPRLEGRKAEEIVAQMQAFRDGKREGTVMDRIAKGFTEPEIAAIAAWYAGLR